MGKQAEAEILNEKMIQRGVKKGLKKYKNLSFLEQYAMYMGVAQILEIGLKNLLARNYNYNFDSLEKKTLGQIRKDLEKVNIRKDFLILLKGVVESRNYVAHEILANRGLYLSILGDSIPDNHYDKEYRNLHKAIYELEQLVFLFQWTDEKNGWE